MEKFNSQAISDRLRVAIENSNKSVRQVASEIGIPQKTLNNQVSGINTPSAEVILALSAYLREDVNYLLGITHTPKKEVPEKSADEESIEVNKFLPVYAWGSYETLSDLRAGKAQRLDFLRIPNVEGEGVIFMNSDILSPEVRKGDMIVYGSEFGKDFIISDELYLITFSMAGKKITWVRFVSIDEMDSDRIYLKGSKDANTTVISRSAVEDMARITTVIHFRGL